MVGSQLLQPGEQSEPMGLKDTNIVDLVTKSLLGDDCKLVLFVMDDGSITDQVHRYRLLISKLTNYVKYVSSEDFQRDNPGILTMQAH